MQKQELGKFSSQAKQVKEITILLSGEVVNKILLMISNDLQSSASNKEGKNIISQEVGEISTHHDKPYEQ